MNTLYMKQKVFSLRGRFTIKDADENDRYFVEGSFMKLPKSFTISDKEGHEITTITKKTFSFLPKFYVDVEGQETVTISKEFTLFKPRYTIDAAGIDVQGNWWDMDFQVMQNGQVIGSVQKKWLSWGDSYEIQVMDETMEYMLISIVVAIDCAKSDQAAGASAAT
ncbi:LURP-one-related/scramblase family protein [Exiguobacterium mexicanum]|uniref:LURP-one-related family protein n=1 Tax=Exiguobacterium mexicanum TaxID=340146 RepID=A0ABT7MNP7_9BACL|nr:LURP-one-related family protein [Exiguobacterium mexicanum]MDL5376828.1 LURP-one-related family protein [Exiguobacterium mexicanum]